MSRFGLKAFGGRRSGKLDEVSAWIFRPEAQTPMPLRRTGQARRPGIGLRPLPRRGAQPFDPPIVEPDRLRFSALYRRPRRGREDPGPCLGDRGQVRSRDRRNDRRSRSRRPLSSEPRLRGRPPHPVELPRLQDQFRRILGYALRLLPSRGQGRSRHWRHPRPRRLRRRRPMRPSPLLRSRPQDSRALGLEDRQDDHRGSLRLATLGKGPRAAPTGAGSATFWISGPPKKQEAGGEATASIEGGELRKGEHNFSILLVDAADGEALPLYYTGNTTIHADSRGRVRRGIHLLDRGLRRQIAAGLLPRGRYPVAEGSLHSITLSHPKGLPCLPGGYRSL